MRLVRQALEPKDRLVGSNGCEHPWPCYGKPAIIFHCDPLLTEKGAVSKAFSFLGSHIRKIASSLAVTSFAGKQKKKS